MSERARNMYYIEGSTVRKMDVAPDKERVPEQRPAKPVKKRAPLPAAADRALAFNLKYTVFVTMSMFIMVCACVAMLYMETKINTQQKNINSLESELEAILDDNAAYRVNLENMYTLDQIYDVATNELGMVYAKKGQIVYYESANEDYVKQYQDVPEAN